VDNENRAKPEGGGTTRALKQPPMRFLETQGIIRQIEERLGAPLLSYWNSVSGAVCDNDVMALYEILGNLGRHKRIFLFIKSDGGSGKASLRLVHVLRQYAERFTALVPLCCASAATMIALGADEIRMGPLAYLTPVDTSLTHDLSPIDRDNDRVSVALDEVNRVIRLWRRQDHKEASPATTNPYQALFQYVHPLVIGAVDRASSLSTRLCTEILSYHMRDGRRAAKISQHLNSAYPAHGYPITFREAQRIGLNVKDLDHGVNDLLIELNERYSEMGQTAITDFDETNHHDNQILNILESRDLQIFFQVAKDWHYRKEERRWVSMNDESGWYKVTPHGKRFRRTLFHIR
jgi:hypothetical protein